MPCQTLLPFAPFFPLPSLPHRLLVWLALLLLLTGRLPAAHAGTLYVGQVLPLSGAAASIGQPLSEGAQACFNKINAEGGVHGHRIALLQRDDAFLPDRTLAQTRALLAEQPQLLGLINIVGAPNNAGLVSTGLLAGSGLSVVGAFTGATSVRALKSPQLYFLRASVRGEARRMLQQLMTMGIRRIGLLRANDAFGDDAQAQLESALATQQLNLAAQARYEPATVDVQQAALQLAQQDLQALLVFGTGSAASQFVLRYRAAGGMALLLLSSATSADVLLAQAGKQHARGIGLVQVMPPMTMATLPLLREYQQALAAHGPPGAKPSTTGLEGYVAARLLAEAIRRSGSEPTRDKVSQALARLGAIDLGGLHFDFRDGQREGATYLQIGILSHDGRLLN